MKASSIKKLVWLGAGELQKPHIDFDLFSDIILVEARSEALKSYESNTGHNIQLIDKMITFGGGEEIFFQHSFADFSSTKQPTLLKNIFPGNQVLFERKVTSITIEEVLKLADLQSKKNTLIIDLPCLAGEIIEKLVANKQLGYFDVIYLHTGKEALYEGAVPASQLVKNLEQHAYSLDQVANDDPDIPLLRFTYNVDKAQILDLQYQLEEQKNKYNEVYSWFASRKKQALELESRVNLLKEENRELKSALSEQTSLFQIEAKLSSLLEKQRSESVEIANALGQHVTKCTRDIEEACQSAIELQKLSGIEHSPLPYSPYTMSAGNLVQLASLVRKNNFDLIIEFGSGVSTSVVAGAANKKSKVVSFEQSEAMLNKTYDLLADNHLQESVELCYTPLTTSEYRLSESSSGIFYDCKQKLAELSHSFDAEASNILVIIDGPDVDASEQDVRYASFPLLLDCFKNHTLTFFLDDSKRKSEQAVLAGWQEEAARREIHTECENIHTGRGAAIVKISQ